MALPGELAGFNGVVCNCGKELPLQVCQSNAGYYLGYHCSNCGPYSRETDYMTKEQAEEVLTSKDYSNARTTEFNLFREMRYFEISND